MALDNSSSKGKSNRKGNKAINKQKNNIYNIFSNNSDLVYNILSY
jgi:hypothetical protein